jgi:hypothetical protein
VQQQPCLGHFVSGRSVKLVQTVRLLHKQQFCTCCACFLQCMACHCIAGISYYDAFMLSVVRDITSGIFCGVQHTLFLS